MTLKVNFGTLVTLFPFEGVDRALSHVQAVISTFQPEALKESLLLNSAVFEAHLLGSN